MKLRIISTLVVLLALAGLSLQSFAGPSDFSICEDLTGPARGLCHAGVAVGCDSDGSSNACAQIAEQFENVTGEPPPYSLPSVIGTSRYGLWHLQTFAIADPLGRITTGDFVIVYPANGNAVDDGQLAINIQVTNDGQLTGTAPIIGHSGLPQDVFFRVARNSYDNTVFPDIAARYECQLVSPDVCPR